MRQPERLMGIVEMEVKSMFMNLKPELAEKCRAAYLEGVRQARQGPAHYPMSIGSEMQGTQMPRSSALTVRRMIAEDSPLVALARPELIRKCIAEVSFVFGHHLDRDQVSRMTQVLINGEWTESEIERAAKLIPNDDVMCKEIVYNRTINPTVFTMARKTFQVMCGRLFTYKEAQNVCLSHDLNMSMFEPVSYRLETMFLIND